MNDTHIVYNFIETPLGDMIVGIFNNQCCLLDFKDRKSLQNYMDKKESFLNGKFVEGDHPMIDIISNQLSSYFRGTLKEFDIPLLIVGSQFQKRVWQQLLTIPYGKTSSYGKIAKQLNKPNSSRAVGNANGSNNIAIVIPCHRVIGEDGSLVGYGGGKHRKKLLLELEAKYSTNTAKVMDQWFAKD